MPRGGPPTNTYTLPAVYLAIPGTTILATQHNSPLEDIADVLNDPWPTNIGGTGGTSIITSYDSLNSRGTDVPTSSTIDLDAVTGPNIHLTGAVTASAVSLSNGRVRTAVADSAFLITAGASLVVNGYTSGNVAVPAGTVLTFVGSTAGIVYVAFSDSGAASFVGYTTTATAAGTTTLTAASTYQQYFTGATTQTVVLPVTSTLNLGSGFRIVNNSTGIVTVNSSGANAVVAMQPATQAIVTCILTSGTTAASWSIEYVPVTANANSNTILVADGTVSLPAYSFKSDPDTGIYSIGADNIGVAANGAKVVDIATTGVAVTGTASATDTISTTNAGVGFVGFLATSTEAAAAAGPILDLYRNSASPAVNDVLGVARFTGKSSTGVTRTYGQIGPVIQSPTNAAESSQMQMSVMVAGTPTTVVPITTIRTQTFTANGTYTPNANMIYCRVEAVGGGGGGGGAAAATALTLNGGGGGGAGEFSALVVSAATIGASQVVTIGTAGAAATAGNNSGGSGGATSLGTIVTAGGGAGGSGSAAGSPGIGGGGGTGGTGSLKVGDAGSSGMAAPNTVSGNVFGGKGGSSPWGAGGVATSNGAGNAATGFGSGGGGGSDFNATSTRAGGVGTIGKLIVTEFCAA